MLESSPSEKALHDAINRVALWMMAGPLPHHYLPSHEHAFEPPLQPMTICLQSGTFKTHDEYSAQPSIRSKEV